MASFQDLGLRDSLLHALEEADLGRPTALQEALIPVVRREGNVVARASSGSGKTLAYGLGLLDHLAAAAEEDAAAGAGEEGVETEEGAGEERRTPRALVLVPTPEAAARVASALVPFAQAVGLSVTVPGGGWGLAPGVADLVVATPEQALAGVRASEVKLDGLRTLVLDGASDVEALGRWEAVETLFDHLPREAQRILLTPAVTDGVEDFAERRVRRALRFPVEPAVPEEAPAVEDRGPVGYLLVPERERVSVLARLLGARDEEEGPPLVFFRTDERAAEVAEALALRGFVPGAPGDGDADVAIADADADPEEARAETGSPALTVSFDVPADEGTLLARHAGERPGYVFVEPRELPHLRDVARRAGLKPRPAGFVGEPAAAVGDVRVFRERVRQALREEDLGAQMLVLEPLLEEFAAAEVAAALGALLRRRGPVAEVVPSALSAPVAAPEKPADAVATDTGRPAEAAISRLFVGVGHRDGVRPGDLVGAIAGETDIPGTKVGRIEIRDNFSIVEVPADLADRVIRAVNGTTIKGRSVRVDYDRGGKRPAGQGSRGGPRSGPPRGGPGGGRRLVRRPPRKE